MSFMTYDLIEGHVISFLRTVKLSEFIHFASNTWTIFYQTNEILLTIEIS